MKDSNIEWTDHTFNPWWGCVRVSEGCTNCYAEAFAKRTGHDVWGRNAGRRTFGDKHWNEPVKWNRDAEAAGVPAFVFCASMADVFEVLPGTDDLPAARSRLWELVDNTPWLTWLLLTKRPENVRLLTPWRTDWPPNAWLGVTAENQDRAYERIPWLLEIDGPARRFVSYEPAIGPVDFCDFPSLDWIICGGESGPGHRPFDPQWARDVQYQCERTGTAFFFKQHGGRTPKANGRELDGRTWSERPPAFIPTRP